MADVYFASVKTDASLLDKVSDLYARVGDGIFKRQETVALKLHFGELGNTAFIRPVFVRRIVSEVKRRGGRPFLTDTNTLYVGKRGDSVDHLNTAIANGFGYAAVEAPIIIADGIKGKNSIDVEIKGKHVKTARIGADIFYADSIVVISHVKGHMLAGFGGAIKNLGMGCASRAGKQQQHSSVKPEVNASKCLGCMRCADFCQVDAIKKEKGKAVIDKQACQGCGECTVSCPNGAIAIRWDSSSRDLQEKMADYALAVLKNKRERSCFFNFLVDITPDCDCFNRSDAPIVPNIGILASRDPVAIDQASLDLIKKQVGLANSALGKPLASGEDKFKALRGLDATIQIRAAEGLGLGSRKYKLVEI